MQHKSACLLHALSLESGTEGDLKKLLGRVAGFCTDMGTELGIADAVSAPLSLPFILPPRSCVSAQCRRVGRYQEKKERRVRRQLMTPEGSP